MVDVPRIVDMTDNTSGSVDIDGRSNNIDKEESANESTFFSPDQKLYVPTIKIVQRNTRYRRFFHLLETESR